MSEAIKEALRFGAFVLSPAILYAGIVIGKAAWKEVRRWIGSIH